MGRRLIIVGGGIGGLSAALALEKAGMQADVFERSPVFGEAGTGMSLWPNATRVLKSWGLLETLLSEGEPVTARLTVSVTSPGARSGGISR